MNEGDSEWALEILCTAAVLDFHWASRGTGKVAEDSPSSFSKVSEMVSLVVWNLAASRSLHHLPRRARRLGIGYVTF